MVNNINIAGVKHDKILHLQYMGWPDLNAPATTEPIVSLVKKVRRELQQMNKNEYKILVHCSAGVGRTGTFIALHKLMDFMDETLLSNPGDPNGGFENTIDIFNTVLQLRSKRMFMVGISFQFHIISLTIT